MRFTALLFLASVAFAEAPDSVNGLIYRVHSLPIVGGGSSAPYEMNEAYSFNADGTYLQLYFIRWGLRDTPQWTYREPTSGSFTYRKTSATRATITLSPAGGSALSPDDLVFTSDLGGFLPDSRTFQFTSPKVSTPLLNLSTRLFVPAGKSGIVGLVAGKEMRAVLVRAIGPGLSSFGVAGFLKNPRLSVYRTTNLPPPQTNDDWEQGGSTLSIQRVQSMVGAFPLASGSQDACLVVPLGARDGSDPTRSVVVDSGDASDFGEVLIEVYLIP